MARRLSDRRRRRRRCAVDRAEAARRRATWHLKLVHPSRMHVHTYIHTHLRHAPRTLRKPCARGSRLRLSVRSASAPSRSDCVSVPSQPARPPCWRHATRRRARVIHPPSPALSVAADRPPPTRQHRPHRSHRTALHRTAPRKQAPSPLNPPHPPADRNPPSSTLISFSSPSLPRPPARPTKVPPHKHNTNMQRSARPRTPARNLPRRTPASDEPPGPRSEIAGAGATRARCWDGRAEAERGDRRAG